MFHDKDKIWKDFWYFFLNSNIKISSPQAIAKSSFCLRLTSCSLDCIHWPKSAKLSRGQMAQIIVRKIRPRKSNKWTKLAFSAWEKIKTINIILNKFRQYRLTFSSSLCIATLHNYTCLTELRQVRLQVLFLLWALSFLSLAYTLCIHLLIQLISAWANTTIQI